MESVRLLSMPSLLWLYIIWSPPLTSATLTGSISRSTTFGASTMSIAASLESIETEYASSLSMNSLYSSTEGLNIKEPVTVLKTIDLIPVLVLSDSSVGAGEIIEPTQNLFLKILPLAINEQQIPSSTTTLGDKAKRPNLQPIIVGDITYIPVHAHHTHSNGVHSQQKTHTSQAHSEAVERHDTQPDKFNHEILESGEDQVGLPPAIVSGLTYWPIGNEFEPIIQTPMPVSITGSGAETGKSAAKPSAQGGTMAHPWQSDSTAAKFQDSANPVITSPVTMQLQNPTSTFGASVVVSDSQAWNTLPESSGLVLKSSMPLDGSCEIRVDSSSHSLNPSVTLFAGSSTFRTATSGLDINESSLGALTAVGETFTPLSNTAISADSNKHSISGLAVTKTSTDLPLTSGGFIIGSSTFAITTTSQSLAPAFPFAISGQSIIPASPPTFIIASKIFTAYPSGLAIDRTEVFQGSTAITLSGTPISLGSSDIVIGTRTIPFVSITGLGPALSSGLSATSSGSQGSGPTSTNQSEKKSHQSAAGQLNVSGNVLIMCFEFVALCIALV